MDRFPVVAVATAVLSGLLHVAIVLALFARAAYPTMESAVGIASLAVTAFAFGAIALFVSAYTRLLTPAIGFLTVFVATIYLELTSPLPEWSELNGYVIVEGSTHVASYAGAWYVWLALLLYASVIEFAIRRGYGVGEHRLRNLPELPLSRSTVGWVVALCSGLIGAATTLLVIRVGIRPTFAAVAVFGFAVAVAAVPLLALLSRGLLTPTVLFALVPYFLTVEVFITTDSPVHILLFGPYAVVLAVAWALEALIRSRLRGWDGGRFTGLDPSV